MADGSSNDSEDEEYFPEGVGSSASEESDGEVEWTPSSAGKRGKSRPTRRRSKRGVATTRPRRQKKPINFAEDESEEESSDGCEGGDSSEGGDNGENGDGNTETSQREKQDVSRIDNLWASFKQDVGMSKPSMVTTTGTPTEQKDDPLPAKESHKTVSIRTKYDFAGEEIEVNKEVRADSKEAKRFLESQSLTLQSVSSSDTKSIQEEPVNTGIKRRGSGLSKVMQSIGKKQKLSTLEKSHLDWQQFKSSEGLEDELAQSTKDGYLAKQEFLQRADQRQFELEREERLKRFKRLH